MRQRHLFLMILLSFFATAAIGSEVNAFDGAAGSAFGADLVSASGISSATATEAPPRILLAAKS